LALVYFKATDFRCLTSVELEFNAGNNLIVGPNASGKTSILEGVAYLGRAKSFRGAGTRELIRHSASEFVLFGKADTGSRLVSLGVRNGQAGLEIHTNGERCVSASALAEALPLQVIDPDVHELVAGGPEGRRRYIDWVTFHVEHGYLDSWRRFRRALKQRNAALKAGTDRKSLQGWDQQLVELGETVDTVRRRVLDRLHGPLRDFGEALLGSSVAIEYRQGWPADQSLAAALTASAERDRQLLSTQSGPHRADLRLIYDERQARKLVSRGQQKLLACALILAATEVVQQQTEKPLLLLLDDPAAELDRQSVQRLMASVAGLGSQVIATALDAAVPLFASEPARFHVEHGMLRRQS